MDEGIQVGGSPGLSLATAAQREASATGSDRLETHHLLLALLSYSNPAYRAMTSHGVTRDLVESAVRHVIETGAREDRHEITSARLASAKRSGGYLPTLQAERVWLGAIEEAERLGHSAANWGHVLLSLLRETEGIAVMALVSASIDLKVVRTSVLKEITSVSETKI